MGSVAKGRRIFVNVLCWWTAAVAITFNLKSIVSSDGAAFPYPIALTGMTNTLCSPFAFLTSRVAHREGPLVPELQWGDVAKLLFVGVIQGIELACTNKSLAYLSVAQRTIINSSSVLFMMVAAWMWSLERLGLTKAAAAALLTAGGLLQSVTEEVGGTFDPTGVMLTMVSLVFSAQRWSLLQFLMQRSKTSAFASMTKLQLTALIMPTTGVVCFVSAMIFEPEAFVVAKMLRPTVLTSLLSICVCIVTITVCELNIVHLASAVAMQVLGTVHQIPLVLSGIVFFHDRVGFMSAVGFSLSLVGTLVYFKARREEAQRQHDSGPIKVQPAQLAVIHTTPALLHDTDTTGLLRH